MAVLLDPVVLFANAHQPIAILEAHVVLAVRELCQRAVFAYPVVLVVRALVPIPTFSIPKKTGSIAAHVPMVKFPAFNHTNILELGYTFLE